MGFSRQEYWSGVPLPSPRTCCRLCQIMSCLYFFKIFIVLVLTFRYLYRLEFTRPYIWIFIPLGVYLCVWCLGVFSPHSHGWRNPHGILIVTAANLHHEHQQRRVLFVSTPFPALFVCRVLDDDHADQCDAIPHCSLKFAFFYYLVMLPSFMWLFFFKGCELNLPLEVGLLNGCLVSNCFLMTTPRTFLGQVFFTLGPWILWIVMPSSTALHRLVTEDGHKVAPPLHATLFCFLNSVISL